MKIIRLVKEAQLFSRYEKLEIGSTPNAEECAQVGRDDYYDLAIMEIKAYMHQLQRMFPIPESLQGVVSFVKKSNPHDFGTYYELAVKFPEDNEEAADYAYNVENNSPENWDEQAKVELQSLGYFERMEADKKVPSRSIVPEYMREALPKSKPDLPQPPPAAQSAQSIPSGIEGGRGPLNPRDTSSLIGRITSIKLIKKGDSTPFPPATFTYHIDLNERGSFKADVRNSTGKTIFNILAGDELGPDESSIFEHGFMKHIHDMDGLKEYLISVGIMKPWQKLVDIQPSER